MLRLGGVTHFVAHCGNVWVGIPAGYTHGVVYGKGEFCSEVYACTKACLLYPVIFSDQYSYVGCVQQEPTSPVHPTALLRPSGASSVHEQRRAQPCIPRGLIRL